ncbi:MAG: proteasome assembly chaperone family protein [Cuniculiplasma sp.]
MLNEHNITRIINRSEAKFDSPLIIGGFIGQTTLGVTTTSYIIEQFGLHEVALLKSHQIAPVTVFVGGKMRSPFRIYSDPKGKLMIIQCEVPVDIEGLYEITEALMDWVKPFNPKEFVIIDGVPVQDLPEERQAFLVAGLERIKELKDSKIPTAQAALIAGMGGAILNENILSGGKAIALLTHVSVSVPDPDAVLAIVKSLNVIYHLDIKTTVLEESVKKIHEEISKIASEYKSSRQGDEDTAAQDSMYR